MLKEIVKTNGDECVKGYRYFKKIRKCSGYEEVLKKTKKSFSVIKSAQKQSDGKYIVRVRFRWWIILLCAILVIIGVICATGSPKAGVIRNNNKPYIFEPDKTIQDSQTIDKDNISIIIPGYKQFTLNSGKEYIEVYNPDNNLCRLKYYVYIQNKCASESTWLMPGQSGSLNFYEIITDGVYEADIVTKAESLDGTEKFNSVRQTVMLKVNKGD